LGRKSAWFVGFFWQHGGLLPRKKIDQTSCLVTARVTAQNKKKLTRRREAGNRTRGKTVTKKYFGTQVAAVPGKKKGVRGGGDCQGRGKKTTVVTHKCWTKQAKKKGGTNGGIFEKKKRDEGGPPGDGSEIAMARLKETVDRARDKGCRLTKTGVKGCKGWCAREGDSGKTSFLPTE